MRRRLAVAEQLRPIRIYHRMAPRPGKRLLPFWARVTLILAASGALWAILARLAVSSLASLPMRGHP